MISLDIIDNLQLYPSTGPLTETGSGANRLCYSSKNRVVVVALLSLLVFLPARKNNAAEAALEI